MASVDEQIESLEAAIASGARTAKSDDGEVEYRTLKDMRSVLAALKRRKSGTTNHALKASYPTTGRGL